MPNFLKFAIVFLLCIASFGSAFAKKNGTLIQTHERQNLVQCNHLGWVDTPHFNREWKEPCSPLQAKANRDAVIYTIITTDGACPDDLVAKYDFNSLLDKPAINFAGCVDRDQRHPS